MNNESPNQSAVVFSEFNIRMKEAAEELLKFKAAYQRLPEDTRRVVYDSAWNDARDRT